MTVLVEVVLVDALQNAGTRDVEVVAGIAAGASAEGLEPSSRSGPHGQLFAAEVIVRVHDPVSRCILIID